MTGIENPKLESNKKGTSARATRRNAEINEITFFAFQTDSALMHAKEHALPYSLTRFINPKRSRFSVDRFAPIKRIHEGNSKDINYPD